MASLLFYLSSTILDISFFISINGFEGLFFTSDMLPISHNFGQLLRIIMLRISFLFNLPLLCLRGSKVNWKLHPKVFDVFFFLSSYAFYNYCIRDAPNKSQSGQKEEEEGGKKVWQQSFTCQSPFSLFSSFPTSTFSSFITLMFRKPKHGSSNRQGLFLKKGLSKHYFYRQFILS